jgi:hypothetical protein
MQANLAKSRIRSALKITAVITILSLLTACALKRPPFTGTQGLNFNPHKVVINFTDADPCVITSVDPIATSCVGGGGVFCVGRTEFIWWESNPADIRYEIFFDPIYSPRLRASPNGFVLRPIDDRAPIGDYKYSIVREGCDPKKAYTFDPLIRVDK